MEWCLNLCSLLPNAVIKYPAGNFFARVPMKENQISLTQLSPVHLSQWGVSELHPYWENLGLSVSFVRKKSIFPPPSFWPLHLSHWHLNVSVGLALCHHKPAVHNLGIRSILSVKALTDLRCDAQIL